MSQNFDNLNDTVKAISDELQIIKSQNARNAISLNDINNSLEKINVHDGITSEALSSTQENLAAFVVSNVSGQVSELSKNINTLKTALDTNQEMKTAEMRDVLGGLSLKISAIQDSFKNYSDEKHSQLKTVLDDLDRVIKSTLVNIERNTAYGFSNINANLEDLSKTVIKNQESYLKINDSNIENVIKMVNSLSEKMDAYTRGTLEKTTVLYEDIKDVKDNLEHVNSEIVSYIKAQFSEIKDAVQSFDTKGIEERLNSLSMLLSSGVSSAQMEKLFADLNGQFEAIKYTIQKSSTNSEVIERITSLVVEFQNSLKSFSVSSEKDFTDFKQAMRVFNENLNSISNENKMKLAETLTETTAIKMDILALKESIARNSNNDVNALQTKFDNVFIVLSKLEQSLNDKNSELVRQNINQTEEVFDKLYTELKAIKNQSVSGSNILERVELLKNEINLATSDMMNAFAGQYSKIAQNFDNIKIDIKNIVDSSLYNPFENLKQDIQQYIKSIMSIADSGDRTSVNSQFTEDMQNIRTNISQILANMASGAATTSSSVSKILHETENLVYANKGLRDEVSQNNSKLIEYIDAKTFDIRSQVSDLINTQTLSLNNNIDLSVSKIQESLEKGAESINSKTSGSLNELQTNVINIISDRMQILLQDAKSYVKENIEKSSQTREEVNEFLKDKFSEVQNAVVEEIQQLSAANNNEKQMDFISQLIKEVKESFKSTYEGMNESTFEKFDDISLNIQDQVSTLKADLLDEFSSRFQDFKEFYSAQNNMLSLSSEIKNTIMGLEEKLVEVNVNSSMEMSKMLFSLMNEISKLKATDVSEDEIKVLPKTNTDSSNIEKAVFDAKEEIKKILAIQHPLIKKIDGVSQKEDLQILHNNLKEVLVAFNSKLEDLIAINKENGLKSDLHSVIEGIEKTLNSFSKEIISSVVGVFNGISFDVEKQEIKAFVQAKTEDIKKYTNENIVTLSTQLNDKSKDLSEATKLAKFDILNEIREVLYEKIKEQILDSKKAFNENFDDLKDLVKNTSEEQKDTFKDSISVLLTSEQYKNDAQKLNASIQELSEYFAEKLASVDALNDLINDSNNSIELKFIDFKADLVDIVKNTFNIVFDERYSQFLTGFNNVQAIISAMTEDMQSFQKGFEDIKPEIIKTIIEAVEHKISEAQNFTFAKIGELQSDISLRAEEFKANADNRFNNLKEHIEHFGTVNTAIGDKIYNYLSEQIPLLLSDEKSHKYIEDFDKKLDAITEDFLSKLGSVDLLNDLINDQTQKLDVNIESLKSDISSIVKTAFVDEFNEKYEIIKNNTLENLNSIKEDNEKSLNLIGQNLTDILNQEIVVKIQDLKNKTEELLSSNNKSMQTSLFDTENKISSDILNSNEKFENGINDFKHHLEEIVENDIVSNLNATHININQNLSDIRDSIYEKVDSILSAYTSGKNEAGFNIESIKSDLIQKADDVINLYRNSQSLLQAKIEDVDSKNLSNIEDLKSELSNKVAEITDLYRTSEAALKSEMEKIDSNNVSNIEDLKSELSNKVAEITDLYSTSEAALKSEMEKIDSNNVSNIEDLKNNFVSKIGDVLSQFEISNDNISSKIEKVKTDVLSGFDEFISSLDSKMQDYDSRLSMVKDDILDCVEKSVLSLSSNQKQTNSIIDDVNNSIKQNIDEVISLVNSSLETAVDKIDTSKENVVSLQTKIYDYILEQIPQLQTISKSDEQAEEIKNEIKTLSESFANSISSVDALHEVVEESVKEINSDISGFRNDIIDIVKTSFIEAYDDKADYIIEKINNAVNENFENINDILKNNNDNVRNYISDESDNLSEKLVDVKKDILKNIDDLKNLSENTECSITDIKELLLNKFEDITDIKNELSKDSVEKEFNIADIDNLLDEKLETLKDDFLIFNQNKIELSDIETIINENISNLKNTIDETAENSIDKNTLQTVITENFAALKEQLLNEKTDTSLIDIYDLLDARTDNINSKLSQIDKDLLSTDDIKNAITVYVNEIKDAVSSLVSKIDNINLGDSNINEIHDNLDLVVASTESINNSCLDINNSIYSLKDDMNDVILTSENVEYMCQEIKNQIPLIKEQLDELGLSTGGVDNKCSDIKNEINTLKEQIEDLDASDKVDTKLVDLKSEITNLKEHISQIQNIVSETKRESDYPYTFEDVETDILKVRMILKELTETNALARDEGLEKIEEDLVSISTRTNKLLLNSDETTNYLQASIEDLKNLVSLFDNKVNEFDNQRILDTLEYRLDEISKTVYSNAEQNKKLTEAFTYLAEWIDKTDEKLYSLEKKINDVTYVKNNMIEKSDLEYMFERFVNKMDEQQEMINSLEDKVRALSVREPNIKSLVKEVLSSVPDTKLERKVDGIDRQLATLGKNIEKITSYVD